MRDHKVPTSPSPASPHKGAAWCGYVKKSRDRAWREELGLRSTCRGQLVAGCRKLREDEGDAHNAPCLAGRRRLVDVGLARLWATGRSPGWCERRLQVSQGPGAGEQGGGVMVVVVICGDCGDVAAGAVEGARGVITGRYVRNGEDDGMNDGSRCR
jgi:hypothetical protein